MTPPSDVPKRTLPLLFFSVTLMFFTMVEMRLNAFSHFHFRRGDLGPGDPAPPALGGVAQHVAEPLDGAIVARARAAGSPKIEKEERKKENQTREGQLGAENSKRHKQSVEIHPRHGSSPRG